MKELTQFSPKKTAADSLHPYCKLCKAAAQRESRQRHPDYDRRYYQSHPEQRERRRQAVSRRRQAKKAA